MGNPNLHNNTHVKPEFLDDIKLEQDYLYVSNSVEDLKWSLYQSGILIYDVEERPIFFVRWFQYIVFGFKWVKKKG